MPEWTEEQLRAIRARNHTVLVSAAAGSGKTAVLVERAVELVREGVRLSRMLIVTFTRAAAGEMRDRLNQRLTEELSSDPERFGQALQDLGSTLISTIHAFCKKVIMENYAVVGLDSRAQVPSTEERALLLEQAFREALNGLLEQQEQEPSPQGEDLLALLGAFEPDELQDPCGKLYAMMMSMPEPFAWLEDCVRISLPTEDLREHPWYALLRDRALRKSETLGVPLAGMEALLSEPDAVPRLAETLESDRASVEALKDALRRGEPAALSLARLPSLRGLSEAETAWKKRFTDLRDDLKKEARKILDPLSPGGGEAEAMTHAAAELRGLAVLIRAMHGRFLELKRERDLYDFTDMEQFTLRLLKDDEIARRCRMAYDHIFIDECQDVSRIQDAIIQRIHGADNCLFMVGDVKQSIYRFRMADPTLFLARMRSFSTDPDARERAIFLQRNFRSAPDVLDTVNAVFERTMRADATELDYLPEDRLISGKKGMGRGAAEAVVIRADGLLRADQLAAEAMAAAGRLKALEGTLLPGMEHPLQWRDMAILMPRVTGVGDAVAAILQAEGIPVFYDSDQAFTRTGEVEQFLSLLQVTDNPFQDIPLIAALRSPVFGFSDEELSALRLLSPGETPFHEVFRLAQDLPTPLGERCRLAQAQISLWRELCRIKPFQDFVWGVAHESGFYAWWGAQHDGAQRQANIRLLIREAIDYSLRGGFSLGDFISQAQREGTHGDPRTARILGEQENLVHIMTMHKSKGLQYPVVFCLRLGEALVRSRADAPDAHRTAGISLPWIDRELSMRRYTMGREAVGWARELDERAERCRLLYVAMTRAKYRLFLVGCSEAKSASLWEMPGGAARVLSAGSMLDWVMQTALDLPDGPLRVTFADPEAPPELPQEELRLLDESLSGSAPLIGEDWRESKPPRVYRPLKTSVTSLLRRMRTGENPVPGDEEETEGDKRREQPMVPILLSPLSDHPAYMDDHSRLTPAERGTIAHRFLSLAPLEELRGRSHEERLAALRRRREELAAGDVFHDVELDAVSPEAAEAFFGSPLGLRVLASPHVEREWAFTLRYARNGSEFLQGVIDCVFEEGDAWILCDYKTDRVGSAGELLERHRLQLIWYAYALEILSRRPVRECWLYSICLGEAIPVPMGPSAAASLREAGFDDLPA